MVVYTQVWNITLEKLFYYIDYMLKDTFLLLFDPSVLLYITVKPYGIALCTFLYIARRVENDLVFFLFEPVCIENSSSRFVRIKKNECLRIL